MIIAFTGSAGSGKSTAALVLGWQVIKFADPLKAMLRAYYQSLGLNDILIQARIEGHLKETRDPLLCGRTPRYAMQTLGSEWGRDLMAPNFWVSAFEMREKQENLVVDDLRFENEAHALHRAGGVIVKLIGRGGIATTHESEAGVVTYDHLIENTGSIEDLTAKIRKIVDV